MAKPKVAFGQLVATPAALAALSHRDIVRALRRHRVGDWGDVCPDDARANDEALAEGERLLSVYHAESGTKFYVITERDRSATTVLLPEDY